MNLTRDIPLRSSDGDLHVIVETPRHSHVKIKYEEGLGFVWSRPLTLGVAYPYDFGFFPQTRAEDGDPLDAMVYAHPPSYPGVIIPCRVIGALCVEQRRGRGKPKRNDRVIVVPVDEKRRADVDDIRKLPQRVREELEEFFQVVILLTGKKIALKGWAGPAEARRIVAEAARAWGRGRS